jgi:ubiquinone/menaquinone biosynthesis C-methylase UbiE
MRRFWLGVFAGLLFMYGLRRVKTEKYNQDRIALYYQRRAKSYQATDQWVQFWGYAPRILMRQKLVEHVRLQPGDRVLDIGCGAGSNFPYIMEKIGETGELVGVDYSQEMLDEAQKLIDANGWKNVFLVQEDAAQLHMGETYDVVLSALAMVVIPGWEAAMQRAFEHVRPGGMFGIADLCESQRWYMAPVNTLMDVMDATLIIDTTRKPWEMMEPWVEDYRREDLMLGYMYVASGRKPKDGIR